MTTLSRYTDAQLRTGRDGFAKLASSDSDLSLDAQRLANDLCHEIEDEIEARSTGIYGSRDIVSMADPSLDDCITADARYL